MTLNFFWLLTGIGLYLVALLLLLWWTKPRGEAGDDASGEAFFLGRHGQSGLHPLLLLVSYAATVYSAFTLIGMPGFIYQHGVGAFGAIVISQLLQVACILFFGMALWRRAQEFPGATSPIEIVSRCYNSPRLGLVVFMATVLFVIPHLTVQLVGIRRLIEGVTDVRLGYLESVGAILIVMVLYSELGGFRGIVWTDVIQFVLSVGGMTVLAWLYIDRVWDGNLFELTDQLVEQGDESLLSTPGPAGFYTAPMLFSLCLFYGLWPIAHPSSAVRFLAQSSPRGFLWMVGGMACMPVIMFLPALVIGLGGAAAHPDLGQLHETIAGQVVSDVVSTGGALATVFGFCYILGSLSAAMSTCDSQALAMGQIVSRDLVKGVLSPNISPRSEMRTARLAIMLVFLVSFALGFNKDSFILRLSVLSGSGTAVLVPTYLGIRLRQPHKWAALASIASGYTVFLWGETMLAGQTIGGFHPGVIAVGTSAMVFLGASAMLRKR